LEYTSSVTGVVVFDCTIVWQGTATSTPRFNMDGVTGTYFSLKTVQHTVSATVEVINTYTTTSASPQTPAVTSGGLGSFTTLKVTGARWASGGGALTPRFASSTAGQIVTVLGGMCIYSRR
jgi:hypothetical protein